MENAGVERRQFHAMLFGQFGQIQIGKFSAGLRGDSLRRKIVRDKPATMFPKKFRESISAKLWFGPKRECLATADSQKAKFANRASGRLFPAQPAFNSRLVLMVPPDCGNEHVDIKEIGHGGNCSSALKISSREIGRPMESSECFPFRRMIRTLFRGFRFGRSIRTNTRRPSPSGRTLTTSPVSMRASFRAFAGITICPRP